MGQMLTMVKVSNENGSIKMSDKIKKKVLLNDESKNDRKKTKWSLLI